MDFISSPLVLDYVHVRFTCTLPPWSSRNPFQPTVNEGFYKYKDFAEYKLSDVLQGPAVENSRSLVEGKGTLANQEGFFSVSFLLRSVDPPPSAVWAARHCTFEPSPNQLCGRRKLKLRISTSECRRNVIDRRFLQGWDHTDSTQTRNVPRRIVPKGAPGAPTAPDPDADANAHAHADSNKGKDEGKNENEDKGSRWNLPHLTILPGLQFTLAGILGKPETCYHVPVIRFIFEILSFL